MLFILVDVAFYINYVALVTEFFFYAIFVESFDPNKIKLVGERILMHQFGLDHDNIKPEI